MATRKAKAPTVSTGTSDNVFKTHDLDTIFENIQMAANLVYLQAQKREQDTAEAIDGLEDTAFFTALAAKDAGAAEAVAKGRQQEVDAARAALMKDSLVYAKGIRGMGKDCLRSRLGVDLGMRSGVVYNLCQLSAKAAARQYVWGKTILEKDTGLSSLKFFEKLLNSIATTRQLAPWNVVAFPDVFVAWENIGDEKSPVWKPHYLPDHLALCAYIRRGATVNTLLSLGK